MEYPINRQRIRFIEYDYIYSKIKRYTEFLDDEAIEVMLGDHQWDDLTFIFDIRPHGVKTLVFDNIADHEMALADLSFNANQFYQCKMKEFNKQNPIQRIKDILYAGKREEVIVWV